MGSPGRPGPPGPPGEAPVFGKLLAKPSYGSSLVSFSFSFNCVLVIFWEFHS